MQFMKHVVCVSFIIISLCLFYSCNSDGEGAKLSVTQISSDSVVIGETDLTITVNGSGFKPESRIRWNGSNCPTTFVSSTELTAVISERDGIYPGDNDVSVYNLYPYDEESNTIQFVIEDRWIYLGAPTANGYNYYNVHQVLADSEDSQIIYVSIHGYGLFITRDGGSNWELAVPGDPPIYGFVAQDPENPDRLFYGQRNKVYVSIDRGLTWELIHTLDEDSSLILTIAFSKFYPGTIYISTGGSYVMFHRSQDDGVSWQSYSYGQTVGLDNFIPWTMAEDPIDGTLYSGVELGRHEDPYYPPFLRSQDGGETWENLVEGMTSRNEGPIWHVVSIAIDPDSGEVYAVSEGPGIYTSLNQGETWTRTRVDGAVIDLILDPWQEDRLFGGAIYFEGYDKSGGVYISSDGGKNYYPFGLQGHGVTSLSFSEDGEYLYAGTYGSGIFYTTVP